MLIASDLSVVSVCGGRTPRPESSRPGAHRRPSGPHRASVVGSALPDQSRDSAVRVRVPPSRSAKLWIPVTREGTLARQQRFPRYCSTTSGADGLDAPALSRVDESDIDRALTATLELVKQASPSKVADLSRARRQKGGEGRLGSAGQLHFR